MLNCFFSLYLLDKARDAQIFFFDISTYLTENQVVAHSVSHTRILFIKIYNN
jgi:hypothetical protein